MKTSSIPKIIWFIDDDAIINHVNKRLCELSNFGSKIETFTSQTSALNRLIECIKDDHEVPELIFLDFMMPKLDGLLFLEKVESKIPDLHNKTKIIFLSSTESEEDINKIKSKFQTKFLSKPLTKAHIDSLKFYFFFERQ